MSSFSNIDINLTVSLIEANYANNGRSRRRFPVRSMLLALMFMRLRLYRLLGSFVGGLGTTSSPGRSAGLATNTRPYSFQQIHQACMSRNSREAIPQLSILSLQNGGNRLFRGYYGWC